MLGAILIIVVAWSLPRLWPTAVGFILGLAAIGTAWALIQARASAERFGEQVNYTPAFIASSYALNVAIEAGLFGIVYFIARAVRKRPPQ